jgi:outer membrane lipoprotein-sorting protein
MKRNIYIIFACLLLANGISAQNAIAILDKAAAAYNTSNGLSATFAIRAYSEQQNIAESFEGKINMKGDKFTLQTPNILTWYNGSTQWVYITQAEEVNISTPTGDELQLTNPSILLNSYKKGFTAVFKGESTAPNGKAAYDVTLTPKKKSDVTKIELQIEKYSSLPACIVIQMKNGLSNTIVISDIKTGINQPDSFFLFNEAAYPDAEIIDLR